MYEEETERQERKQREKERKKEEEYSCVCVFRRVSLNLHLPQPVLWRVDILKNRLGEREREYRLEREREAEKQRERAGVGNPPLHLLVIYSFMFPRRLAR